MNLYERMCDNMIKVEDLITALKSQDREKAKTHLKNAIIGFVLIFVLLLVLNRAIGPLTTWVTQNSNNSGL